MPGVFSDVQYLAAGCDKEKPFVIRMDLSDIKLPTEAARRMALCEVSRLAHSLGYCVAPWKAFESEIQGQKFLFSVDSSMLNPGETSSQLKRNGGELFVANFELPSSGRKGKRAYLGV